jgi:ubiquinone/menaquinone biosynthesis C-methylase UbiE
MKTVINLKSEVYYHGIYWNDYKPVVEYMCKNFTGDKNKWWVEDFKERYAAKPFEHALSLNCGDGRWERDFIDKKIVKKITAFDVSPDLIKKANELKDKRGIKYFVADANKVNFRSNQFDLIINYAALHHTQYINRMCRVLSSALKPGGVFVNFEYIGPHRNQYPFIEWVLLHFVNNKLGDKFKQNLHYPHIPTMLATDPTEAIHSELIINTVKRYFNIIEKHDTGGAIAYPLITHNKKMISLPKKEVYNVIPDILKFDENYSNLHLVPRLFSYFIATPDKKSLKNKLVIKKYIAEENQREALASKRRGVYSFIDYLKLVKNNKTLKGRVYLLLGYPYFVDSVFVVKKIFGLF